MYSPLISPITLQVYIRMSIITQISVSIAYTTISDLGNSLRTPRPRLRLTGPRSGESLHPHLSRIPITYFRNTPIYGLIRRMIFITLSFLGGDVVRFEKYLELLLELTCSYLRIRRPCSHTLHTCTQTISMSTCTCVYSDTPSGSIITMMPCAYGSDFK